MDNNCDYQGHEFGASYPDSVCIGGTLWDADSGYPSKQYGAWVYSSGGDIPCPKCNPEGNAEYYRCDFCKQDERKCDCQQLSIEELDKRFPDDA